MNVCGLEMMREERGAYLVQNCDCVSVVFGESFLSIRQTDAHWWQITPGDGSREAVYLGGREPFSVADGTAP